SVQGGAAPLTVAFTGSGSTGSIVGYHWDFGDGTVSTEPDPVHTFLQAGNYLVSLTVEGESDSSDTMTLEVTVLPEEVPEGFSLYLNTGTAADVSFNGRSYLGDANFGSYYSSSGTYTVSTASDQPLYVTERNGKTLNYAIPVPNGIYTVQTHHMELYVGLGGPAASPGRRVFDISMEGTLVKDNFDIFVEGSNQPTVLTFEEIAVSDGVLNINMAASVNNVSISGITIKGGGNNVDGAALRRAFELGIVESPEASNPLKKGELLISLYPNPTKS